MYKRQVNEQGDTFALDWDIQKGSEVSTWIAIPKYKDGKMFETCLLYTSRCV